VIDHTTVNVSDLETSRRFYAAALRPLGYAPIMEFDGLVAFGTGEGAGNHWIARRGEPTRTAHIAFRAPERAAVDAFHAAGVAAGGRDNGAPGLRPQYHETYYGAFVLDPDGNNVEAVCHEPE
jgi:catechol 2,3-dioxygenase-like lactoylglutathione lyase family enzyme